MTREHKQLLNERNVSPQVGPVVEIYYYTVIKQTGNLQAIVIEMLKVECTDHASRTDRCYGH